MRILVGMPSKDSWGGPISSEPPFVNALRRAGCDVIEADYVYGDKESPTPIIKRIRRVWKTAFKFRRLLKESDFDIVHLNTAFDLRTILRDSFSLFVMKPGKTKVFYKFHGSEGQRFFQTNFLIRLLIKFIAGRADGFGVHTSAEISDFQRLNFDLSKFFLVKNATKIGDHSGMNNARRQKEADDRFELLFVGRFVPAKCLMETIEAHKMLVEKGYDVTLKCVGDGEMKEPAERKVAGLEFPGRVEFTGYVPEKEVDKFFQESDILLFPTRYGEGFPNVLFKAVTRGMPIVSSVFRAAEYLVENKNCLFCTLEPGDIAAKVGLLIDDKKLRESMSSNNFKLGDSLTPEAIAEEFISIYNKITEVS